MFGYLLKLYAILASYILYIPAIAFLVLALNVGVFSWLVILACLTPTTLVWYIIMKHRIVAYLKLLMDNKPRIWNVTRTVAEYLELLKKQRKSRKS